MLTPSELQQLKEIEERSKNEELDVDDYFRISVSLPKLIEMVERYQRALEKCKCGVKNAALD